jgi:hypothetical protein
MDIYYLRNKGLGNLYTSAYVVTVVKPIILGWTVHVDGIGRHVIYEKILYGNLLKNNSFEG